MPKLDKIHIKKAIHEWHPGPTSPRHIAAATPTSLGGLLLSSRAENVTTTITSVGRHGLHEKKRVYSMRKAAIYRRHPLAPDKEKKLAPKTP